MVALSVWMCVLLSLCLSTGHTVRVYVGPVVCVPVYRTLVGALQWQRLSRQVADSLANSVNSRVCSPTTLPPYNYVSNYEAQAGLLACERS